MKPCAILILLLTMTLACDTTPAPPNAPKPLDSAQLSQPRQDPNCPSGTLMHGAAPPHGYFLSCRLPDGTTPHGPHTRWHSNGKLAEVGTFDHGKRTGTWTTYHVKNGRQKSHGTYVDDQRHGTWTFHRKNATLKETSTYHQGQLQATRFSE